MSVTAEQALREAEALPTGEEQVAAVERAFALAEREGDLRTRIDARVALVSAYDAAAPGERELPLVAWLLHLLDDPASSAQVTAEQRTAILRHSGLALDRARRLVSVSLPVVHRMYDDVERRFRAEGVSLLLLARHRALLARDLDEPAAMERWLTVWRESPRDRLAGCEACDVALDARFLAEAGRYQGALDRARTVLEGRLRCEDEPAGLYAAAADWAMRVGLPDLAEAYHRTGWIEVVDRPGSLPAAADHVVYLLRAARPARAVRIALDLVPRLGERVQPDDRMRTSAVLARALRAGRGHGLAPATVLGGSLDDAVRELESESRTTAASYDARNGTKRVSRRLAAHVKVTAYAAHASPDALAADRLERVLLVGGDLTGDQRGIRLPDGILGYAAELERASEAFDAERVVQLVDGWSVHRTELLPAYGASQHLAVAYLERRALASTRAQQDPAFVDTLLERATESARLSGDPVAAQRTEVEVLHRRGLAGDADAWVRARKIAAELEAAGELREAAGALMSLSRNPDTVRGLHDAVRAANLFARAGLPRWQVTALQAAGYAAVWADPAYAEELLTTAHAGAIAHGIPAVAVAITATRAKLAWRQRDYGAAVAGLREAVEGAEAFSAADPMGLRVELCEALLQTQAWEGLIDCAHELLVGLPMADRRRRAQAHRVLGLGLLETGNAAEAVEVLEPAVRALVDEPTHGIASWTLARALTACGRADLAAPHYAAAAAWHAAEGRFSDAALTHQAAGSAASEAGDPARAADHFREAARAARYVGEVDQMVGALRRLAAAQAAQGRLSDALTTLDSVVDQARAVLAEELTGPEEQRLLGLVEHQAAELLAGTRRRTEAEELLATAVRRLEVHGRDDELADAEAAYLRLTGVVPGRRRTGAR